MLNFILTVQALTGRELLLFFRQKNRLVGAFLQPLIFWLLMGAGFNSSFQPLASHQYQNRYSDYFFPGVIVMVIMFTAVFSTMSLIEDRKHGFMQGILVAPVSRYAIVFGKILGGTLLGMIQGIFFLLLLLTPYLELTLTFTHFLQLLGWMFVMGFGLTGLGFAIAWKVDSTQGYHAIMSVFLFPLWIFSGALFPAEGTPWWMNCIIAINPLTYGVQLIRGCFIDTGVTIGATAGIPNMTMTFGSAYMLVFGLATLYFCTRLIARG